jgi:hypothetical protein
MIKKLLIFIFLISFVGMVNTCYGGITCSSLSVSDTETFETDYGNWSDGDGDGDFDWARDSGGTGSGDTGPSVGYDSSDWYVYTEASTPNYPYKTAYLQFDTDPGNYIDFWINGVCDQDNLWMGTIVLEEYYGAAWHEAIAQDETNLGTYSTGWVQMGGWLNPASTLIRFRVDTDDDATNGWCGDYALDNIRVGTCNDAYPDTGSYTERWEGEPIQYQASDIQNPRSDFNLTDSTGVVCYTDNGAEGECVAYTVSGQDVTAGSAVTVDSDWEVSSYGDYGTPAFINTDGDGTFVVAYADDSSDDDGYVEHFTVSGTTITDVGVKHEFNNSDTEIISVVSTDTNVYAICYNDETAGNDGECVACEYDPGVDVTCGGTVAMGPSAAYPLHTSMAQTDAHEFIATYAPSAIRAIWAIHGAVDSSEATTMGSAVQVHAGYHSRGTICSSYENGGTADRFFVPYGGDGGLSALLACSISGTTPSCGAVFTTANSRGYNGCAFITDTVVVAWGYDPDNYDFFTAQTFEINWSTKAITQLFEKVVIQGDTCRDSPNLYCGSGGDTVTGYGTTTPTLTMLYDMAWDYTVGDGYMIAVEVDLEAAAAGGRRRML